MKIKGQRKKVHYEDVEIEVSPSWMLTKIYNAYKTLMGALKNV